MQVNHDYTDGPHDGGPLVRHGSPDTSREAAERIDATRLENLVFQTVFSFGPTGCISDEVREALSEYAYSSVTARFANLIEAGWIVDTGKRRPGRYGRKQRVLVAARFAEGAVDA